MTHINNRVEKPDFNSSKVLKYRWVSTTSDFTFKEEFISVKRVEAKLLGFSQSKIPLRTHEIPIVN